MVVCPSVDVSVVNVPRRHWEGGIVGDVRCPDVVEPVLQLRVTSDQAPGASTVTQQ